MLIHKIIEWLEAGAPHTEISPTNILEGFDFAAWISDTPGSDCGTTACIAGAAVQFATKDFEYDPEEREYRRNGQMVSAYDTGDEAQALLGLTDEQKDLLFYPFELDNEDLKGTHHHDPAMSDDHNPLDWTRCLEPKQVAVVLKHFANTGEIDWRLAR